MNSKFIMLSIFLILFTSSCRFYIGQDNFHLVKENNKQRINKFTDLRDELKPYDYAQVCADDLDFYVYQNEYTLIHLFSPWCKPCREDLISLINNLKRVDNLELVIVSNIYDTNGSIKKYFQKYEINKPILIMSNKIYGSSLEHKHKLFGADLCKEAQPYEYVSSFYLFDKKKRLLYYNYNPPSLDSLDKIIGK